MRKLLPRQEAFAVNVAYNAYSSMEKCYVAAGYAEKGAYAAAFKLLKNVRVAAKIEKLQGKNRKRSLITFDAIVNELIQDRISARVDGNVHASIKVNVELAKLHGLYDMHNKQKQLSYSHMTTPEMIARAKEVIARLE